MDPHQFIVLDRRWLLQEGSHPKRLSKGFCPIGHHGGYLKDGCSLLIKFKLVTEEARAQLSNNDNTNNIPRIKTFTYKRMLQIKMMH